jgi:hypothetical protein
VDTELSSYNKAEFRNEMIEPFFEQTSVGMIHSSPTVVRIRRRATPVDSTTPSIRRAGLGQGEPVVGSPTTSRYHVTDLGHSWTRSRRRRAGLGSTALPMPPDLRVRGMLWARRPPRAARRP